MAQGIVPQSVSRATARDVDWKAVNEGLEEAFLCVAIAGRWVADPLDGGASAPTVWTRSLRRRFLRAARTLQNLGQEVRASGARAKPRRRPRRKPAGGAS
jgi:hypothetical protein